jgi:hypothetical protein
MQQKTTPEKKAGNPRAVADLNRFKECLWNRSGSRQPIPVTPERHLFGVPTRDRGRKKQGQRPQSLCTLPQPVQSFSECLMEMQGAPSSSEPYSATLPMGTAPPARIAFCPTAWP